MTFANNNGDAAEQQVLKDRSVIVSSRFAQDFWVHGIDPCESAEIRYSFTLRHVSPHFINSTIILGDSNTANINFGSGVGKLRGLDARQEGKGRTQMQYLILRISDPTGILSYTLV